MKKLIFKYMLEFLVIVLGISLSFYLEKQNAQEYKESLKNQSLQRIAKNIKIDIRDSRLNLSIHDSAVIAGNWLEKNWESQIADNRDSIGFYLNIATNYNSIFVDNQEEYRALQNSGLIELIENEKLVTGLQNKYSAHAFYKELEKLIMSGKKDLIDFLYENTVLNSYQKNRFEIYGDRKYIGPEPIPNKFRQLLLNTIPMHEFYIGQINIQLKNNEYLLDLIQKETQNATN
jgi:hypothetical protein